MQDIVNLSVTGGLRVWYVDKTTFGKPAVIKNNIWKCKGHKSDHLTWQLILYTCLVTSLNVAEITNSYELTDAFDKKKNQQYEHCIAKYVMCFFSV